MCRSIFFALLFFKLIGLATFSIASVKRKKKHQRRSVSFVYTKLGIFYNVLIGCLSIASNYITVPVLYSYAYLNKTSLTTIIDIVEGVLGSLILSIVSFYYCWNQSAFVKFGNRLIDILNELRRLREPVNCKRIVFISLLVYLLELFLLIVSSITDYARFGPDTASWLATVLPIVVVSWLFLQYFSVLAVIHAVLINFNRIVGNVRANRTEDVDIDYLYGSRRLFINDARIQSILQLRNIHGHLCDICAEVSRFYALPVLSGTALIFCTLLYNVYYFFEPVMIQDVLVDFTSVLNILSWVTFIEYPFYLLTASVTRIMNEIEETGSIVHTLLNNTMDREVRTELKLFSLQLLHRRIKFTANGFFTLDNTLFQSVFSTMATYLIIFIQFQLDTPSSKNARCNCTQ